MPYKLHQAQACPEFLREKGGRSERRETYLDIGFVPQHFVDVVKMLPDHRFDTEGGQGLYDKLRCYPQIGLWFLRFFKGFVKDLLGCSSKGLGAKLKKSEPVHAMVGARRGRAGSAMI